MAVACILQAPSTSIGSFVFTSKVATGMHSYSRSSMYTMTAIRKISVTGGESERRRLKRAYCTNDVPGERSVDEVSCFFFTSFPDFFFFRFADFFALSPSFMYAIRVPIPVSLRRRPPVVSFHCHHGRFVGPDRRGLCSRAFRTASPSFLQTLCANTCSRHKRHLRKGQAVLMPRAAVG